MLSDKYLKLLDFVIDAREDKDYLEAQNFFLNPFQEELNPFKQELNSDCVEDFPDPSKFKEKFSKNV